MVCLWLPRFTWRLYWVPFFFNQPNLSMTCKFTEAAYHCFDEDTIFDYVGISDWGWSWGWDCWDGMLAVQSEEFGWIKCLARLVLHFYTLMLQMVLEQFFVPQYDKID